MSNEGFKMVVGGDVQANTGTYIFRLADEELFEACLNLNYANVLACRQIGKSSLKNAVAERLVEKGTHVVRIDLNRIGQVADAEDWYFSLLHDIVSSLKLKVDLEEWWDTRPRRSTMVQRFLHFFDEVLLVQITGPIVLFIDEIDAIRNLTFAHGFFATVRLFHNERSQNSTYKRLSFVLLGAATPDELINNPYRTPFNVGIAIVMRDFTWEECTPLRLFLESQFLDKGETYFEQIFQWTNGHPYLTQKLCNELINLAPSMNSNLISELVSTIFFKEESYEINLSYVQRKILGDEDASAMLRLYTRILDGKAIADNKKTPVTDKLKFSGIIISDKGILCIRNKIYETVFDQEWVRRSYKRTLRSPAKYIREKVMHFFSLILSTSAKKRA